MVAIRFVNSEDHSRGNEIMFNKQETVLSGKEFPIYFVELATLLELKENKVSYEIINEKDLPEFLSQKGMELYNYLRENSPETLYFNERLPPMGHRRVDFYFEKDKKTVGLELLKAYGKSITDKGIEVYSDPMSGVDLEERVHISAFIPEDQLDDLIGELSQNKITAYDRAHKIFLGQNPDLI